MNDTAPQTATLGTQDLLHHSRGSFIRNLPRGGDTFLSAGCSGNWFFQWIEWTYGKPKHHIGVEYYLPRPENLPDNVTWIANTCSDMSDVASSSCDIVFSGQNYEHLWPDELIGFMLEAARVTREGGLLVIDSPNRDVTRLLNWTHPEHTVEGTPSEAAEAMRLAGFDVTAKKGIWLCRDERLGVVLPFEALDTNTWKTVERLTGAVERPEDSFIWWLEARRAARPPNREALTEFLNGIYDKAWPERLRRMLTEVGTASQRNGEPWLSVLAGTAGSVMYGPYAPLRAGRYACTFEVEIDNAKDDQPAAVCEVVSAYAGAREPFATETIAVNGRTRVQLEFNLQELVFGVEFRCLTTGRADVACRAYVDLTENRAEACPGP